MPITLPGGIIPVQSLSTSDVLYGNRTTSYRWELLSHSAGVDSLLGYLDGVVEKTASLSWVSNQAVKGTGNLKVADLPSAQAGFMTISQLTMSTIRIRPVLIVAGLPEIPLGVFLVSASPEDWSTQGRLYSLELHDKCTVLDQDLVDQFYTVDAATPILTAVLTVISSAGESITVDASVTSTLSSPMVWDPGTSKLQIVNDLLNALGYNSLWIDGTGAFRATPYVLPANRSIGYELLNGVNRELLDGSLSIYSQDWTRDRDLYLVPNKIVAVQTATGATAALTGSYTNTDPTSPFSYPSRGRYVTQVLTGVNCPADTTPNTIAFLQKVAQASLIAQTSVQAAVTVRHLPIPVRVLDVVRFANTPAGIDKRHVITSIKLEANPLGLMETKLQEMVAL